MVSTQRWLRRGHAVLLAALLAVLMIGLTPSPAHAHESREVGEYTFVVGFSTEPAYSTVPNAATLSIENTETEEPFEDLGDDLEVDITFGEETMTSGLRAQFGDPGGYRADFVPSRPGEYTFRFYGNVGDLEVDETFVSGPDTFSDVRDISQEAFPVQDPTTGQLVERMDRELARIEQLAADGGGSSDAQETGDDTEEDDTGSDTMARVLGGGGLALGVIALGTTFARRKS